MAALSVQDRTRIWRALMRFWSKRNIEISGNKFALYNPTANTGVIAKIDDWADSAGGVPAPATGMSGAMSVAERAALDASRRMEILMAVIAARHSNAALRQVLGEEID